MAGTNTFTSTNYNGKLDEYLYKVMAAGADFFGDAQAEPTKGYEPTPACAYLKTGVRTKLQLDRVKYDANPFEDYVTTNPTFASGSDKKKRELDPNKMTLSGTFQPDEWLEDWDPYAPVNPLTNIMMNPQYAAVIMELAMNSAWTQLANLFWQGDVTAGAANPLRFFDGIITKLVADSDGDVNFITPAGVITQSNVVDIITEVWKAIPDKFKKDPNYKLHMSFDDFELLQLYNNDVKKTTVGVLDENISSLFLRTRIVPYLGLPKNYIIGARTTGTADSNFVFGAYFDLAQEAQSMQVAKVYTLGKLWGYRMDFMCDVQYRAGEDVILYKPA